MGVRNAMSVDREVLAFYVKTLKRVAPGATWTGAGIGKDPINLVRWSLNLAGTRELHSKTTCAWTSIRGTVQRGAGAASRSLVR